MRSFPGAWSQASLSFMHNSIYSELDVVIVSRFKMAGFGGFVEDVLWEAAVAVAAGRSSDADHLRGLWMNWLEVELPGRTDEALIDYLESRAVWREERDVQVYKTAGEPCVAFTGFVQPGEVELVALAACEAYPGGSEEAWWTDVVRPRVLQL